MEKLKKLSTPQKFIIVIYIIALIIQSFFVVPFITYETRISSQNVSHDSVYKNGFSDLYSILEYHYGNDERGIRRIVRYCVVNYRQLFFQLLLTSFIALLLLFICKNKNNTDMGRITSQDSDDLSENFKAIQLENKELKRIISESELYRSIRFHASPPKLDWANFVFCSDEEVLAAEEKFAKDMELYVRYKIISDYLQIES